MVALSGGPAGFSDAINATNATLVSRLCTQSGVLVKPSRPALPVDTVFGQVRLTIMCVCVLCGLFTCT